MPRPCIPHMLVTDDAVLSHACVPHPPDLQLEEPLSIEETAERYVRPHLRQAFVDLCRLPISDYLARFGFESELLQVGRRRAAPRRSCRVGVHLTGHV